jgi:hypothetical protein
MQPHGLGNCHLPTCITTVLTALSTCHLPDVQPSRHTLIQRTKTLLPAGQSVPCGDANGEDGATGVYCSSRCLPHTTHTQVCLPQPPVVQLHAASARTSPHTASQAGTLTSLAADTRLCGPCNTHPLPWPYTGRMPVADTSMGCWSLLWAVVDSRGSVCLGEVDTKHGIG